MLYESVRAALESGCLKDRKAFHPLPLIDERAEWQNVSPRTKAYFDGMSRGLLDYEPAPLPASLYARFYLDGNRSRFEEAYFSRRRVLYSLCVAECLENTGRFVDKIIDIIWAVCEESSWVIPAHVHQIVQTGLNDLPLPTLAMTHTYIDLFAAETGSLLAWVKYLLGSRLEKYPAVNERISHELKVRILDVYEFHKHEMKWAGFIPEAHLNNWTPWIYSNLLTVLLLEEADEAKRRSACLSVARGMDAFLSTYNIDGGCDEGPGYFTAAGASVLDTLELFDEASGGKADIYGEPLIRNMASYIMYAHIDTDYYVNFADAGCRVKPNAMLIKRAASRMGLTDLAAYADEMLRGDTCESAYYAQYNYIYRRLKNTVTYKEEAVSPVSYRRCLSKYFAGIQVALLRESASGEGLYLAAKGGHNDESHNHNDVGSYIIYLDGKPVIIDAGVESYRKETFNSQRYTIWTMQSRNHNTAVLGESNQINGKQYAARDVMFEDNGNTAVFSLDMAGAYGEAAPASEYRRVFTLDRAASAVTVTDTAGLTRDVPVTLPLMCLYEPELNDGEIVFKSEAGRLSLKYDASLFTASCAPIPITDINLTRGWNTDTLYRAELRAVHARGKSYSLVFTRGK